MPVVLNKEQSDWRELDGAALIDHNTIFGNPFVIGRDGNRDAVLRKYAQYIIGLNGARMRQKIRRELRGKNLICHCAPQDCHGDVVLIIANARSEAAAIRQIERRYGIEA